MLDSVLSLGVTSVITDMIHIHAEDVNPPVLSADEAKELISQFKMPVDDSEVILCNRKISTYINALAKAGFMIEQFVEETDCETLCAGEEAGPKAQKAKMMPISFCIKARKL